MTDMPASYIDLLHPGIIDPKTWLERRIQSIVRRRQKASGNFFDFEIRGTRGDGDAAVYRWWVIPRNRYFNIYLHKFMQDDKQHLHDHPWWNCSLPLIQGYFEKMFRHRPRPGDTELPETFVRRCSPFHLYFRRPATPHQVIVDVDDNGNNVASWSLFFTGPKVRDWGFACRDKSGRYFWRPYYEYAKPGKDYGQTGVGCE